MTEVPPPTRRARKSDAAQPPVDLPPLPPLPAEVAAAGSEMTVAALDDDTDRLPTAQLEMAAFGDHLIPYVPPAPPKPPSFAPWALGVSIIGLSAALFTGWLLPVGVIAAILAIVSLRRAHDSRRVAVWALSLALLSVAFSAGWLIWGFSQLAIV